MLKREPGPPDKWIKPVETCGVLLLVYQPTADVTYKIFWAAWSQQSAILLSRLTGLSVLTRTPSDWITDQKKSAKFDRVSPRKPFPGVKQWNALKHFSQHKGSPKPIWKLSQVTRLHVATVQSLSLLSVTLAEEALMLFLRQFYAAPVTRSCLSGTVRSFE